MNPFLHDDAAFTLELKKANGNRAYGRLELDDAGKALHRFDHQNVVVVAGAPSSEDPREFVTAVIMIQKNGNAVGKALAVAVGKLNQLEALTREDIDYVFPEILARLEQAE